MPGTPSPSAEGEPSRLRFAFLETFRARLILAFAAVVAIALGLVLATLPRLLDGYFAQQEEALLRPRAQIVAAVVSLQIQQGLRLGSSVPEPILAPTRPLTGSTALRDALGTADSGPVRELTSQVAQADIEIAVAPDPARPNEVAYRLAVPASDEVAAPGQRRDPVSQSESFTLADPFWTEFQASGEAPTRLVTVRISNPFTFRAQTLETIFGVLFIAAGLALAVASVASVLLAQRLTRPIRRMTSASRDLAEGNLDSRVVVPGRGSPELAELATAFNVMAERLEESIEFIRRDRDRSREFLADVSHELRTPIAALRTFNELLRDGADVEPETQREFLESSRQQIERLDWLASNLLDLSKLESGLVALDLRPDDLRAVVESTIQQAEPAARRKGVELLAQLPPEPVRQRHDPQRMGQVLANLVGNALKFTPAGGRITVAVTADAEGALLSVTDTGIGIDAAELPHVFERFYRGSRANEVRAGGSGLGLSIVRSIVEMHGGRVAIESALGRGTSVSVTLPRDVSVSSPATSPA
ncbi:MAG: HAMP domain-containing histidine kinase [Chloroflexi bacterium]|nr:HAMP domain-containing histidine kinase [Chloroflexota bacterium]